MSLIVQILSIEIIYSIYLSFFLPFYSMGGAIAVHTVYRNLIPTVIGLVVIDVVEGKLNDVYPL